MAGYADAETRELRHLGLRHYGNLRGLTAEDVGAKLLPLNAAQPLKGHNVTRRHLPPLPHRLEREAECLGDGADATGSLDRFGQCWVALRHADIKHGV